MNRSGRRTAAALGPADNGRACRLRLGERIVLELPEAPTTGFRWRPEAELDARSPLACVADEYLLPAGAVAAAATPAQAGGQGQRRWCFEARAAGRTELAWRLARPRGDAAERFTLIVEVEA